jgi:hypothetical protein
MQGSSWFLTGFRSGQCAMTANTARNEIRRRPGQPAFAAHVVLAPAASAMSRSQIHERGATFDGLVTQYLDRAQLILNPVLAGRAPLLSLSLGYPA